jgi:hypothetical protein
MFLKSQIGITAVGGVGGGEVCDDNAKYLLQSMLFHFIKNILLL